MDIKKIGMIVMVLLALFCFMGCTHVEDSPTTAFVKVDKQWYGVDYEGSYVPFTSDQVKMVQRLAPLAREAFIDRHMEKGPKYEYRPNGKPKMVPRQKTVQEEKPEVIQRE